MISAVVEQQNDIERTIQDVDAAIRRLPSGEDKRRLRAEQDALRRQSGLFLEPRREPRDEWSTEKWEAKSLELKDEARKWKAAGRLDKADKCLAEANMAAGEAARRRTAGRKTT